jgi:hypothetical protein
MIFEEEWSIFMQKSSKILFLGICLTAVTCAQLSEYILAELPS